MQEKKDYKKTGKNFVKPIGNEKCPYLCSVIYNKHLIHYNNQRPICLFFNHLKDRDQSMKKSLFLIAFTLLITSCYTSKESLEDVSCINPQRDSILILWRCNYEVALTKYRYYDKKVYDVFVDLDKSETFIIFQDGSTYKRIKIDYQ